MGCTPMRELLHCALEPLQRLIEKRVQIFAPPMIHILSRRANCEDCSYGLKEWYRLVFIWRESANIRIACKKGFGELGFRGRVSDGQKVTRDIIRPPSDAAKIEVEHRDRTVVTDERIRPNNITVNNAVCW